MRIPGYQDGGQREPGQVGRLEPKRLTMRGVALKLRDEQMSIVPVGLVLNVYWYYMDIFSSIKQRQFLVLTGLIIFLNANQYSSRMLSGTVMRRPLDEITFPLMSLCWTVCRSCASPCFWKTPTSPKSNRLSQWNVLGSTLNL